MRKLRSIICILMLLLLIPAVLQAQEVLPLRTQELIAEKYDGWSGVLRLWIYEGWQAGSGSLSTWLNRCIAQFEKDHEGVYIQPQYVDAMTLTMLSDSGIHPPDMIIFPPGVVETPVNLLPIEAPAALRPALSSCGVYGGVNYAVPIAMGGYLWAWNTALLERIPDTWLNSGVNITAPQDDVHHRWSAALLALCSGRYAQATAADTEEIPLGDVDLGLFSLSETPEPSATPEPEEGSLLPCQLPEGFSASETAYADFVAGDVAAIPVSQREVRRLEALADQGKGPDWRLAQAGSAAFTDQIVFLGIVDRTSARAQQDLCRQFLDLILSEDCQGQLYRAGAFSVTSAASGYPSYDALCLMEDWLKGDRLVAAPAFDAGWSLELESIAGRFLSGGGEAWALLEELRNISP